MALATLSAFVLWSNGHCVEWLANGPLPGRKQRVRYCSTILPMQLEAHIAVPLAEIVYSTMQGSDIAIIGWKRRWGNWQNRR